MNHGFKVVALLLAMAGGLQLRPLGVVEGLSPDSPVAMRRTLQPSFIESRVCPGDRKAPPTVREALGSRAQRIVVHRYDKQFWPAMTVVADYVQRVVVGVPENGHLYRFPVFSEAVLPEIAASVEFENGERRPIEFANGYVHVLAEDGCEWWGRYLGPDRTKWIVRREPPNMPLQPTSGGPIGVE